MDNPQAQAKDRYTQIPNEILDALLKINLSPYESRVIFYLWRKTFGGHKKANRIVLKLFVQDIRLDRRLIHRTLKRLESRSLIVINRDDKRDLTYGFQEDYEKWRNVRRKKKNVISGDDNKWTSVGNELDKKAANMEAPKMEPPEPPSPEMSKLSSPETPTKESTKEKNIPSPGSKIGSNKIDPDFGIFWSGKGYPKRIAKGAALKAWNSVKRKGILPPIEKILEVLKEQKSSEQWQKENGKFIPYPATWLNQERWDDDLPRRKVMGW